MISLRELCVSAHSVKNTSKTFLQSSLWGEFKSRFGWKPFYFTLEIKDKICPLLVLSRRPALGFSFAYIPWGPEIECGTEELCCLALELKKYLPRNTVFIRYDLPWEKDECFAQRTRKDAEDAENKKLKKAFVDVQAPDTVVIDLAKSHEEILAAMKSKWRYNISLSSKKSVQVKSYGQEILSLVPCPLSHFYSLLKETAERDGILIHSFDYYKTLFELCEKDSECELRLYAAEHEGDAIASIIVLFRGKWATYLYGASSNIKRNLMAPYALQWRAISDAKEKGCQYYDLFGIPPNEDRNHPMAGLYRFKTGFGGKIINRPGCWDYAYRSAAYHLLSFAEKFRKRIFMRKAQKNKAHGNNN